MRSYPHRRQKLHFLLYQVCCNYFGFKHLIKIPERSFKPRAVHIKIAAMRSFAASRNWQRKHFRTLTSGFKGFLLAGFVSLSSFFAHAADFPRQLEDGRGRVVTLPAPPQRIISQTLATDEMLLALCPLERVIGFSALSTDAQYSLIAEAVQASGKARPSGVEQILQHRPDLILTASYNRAETLQQLQASGAQVLQFAHFNSIKNIYANTRLLGRALGLEENAQHLIEKMQGEIQQWQACVDTAKKTRALLLDSWHFTSGKNTTADDLLGLAGLQNIAAQNGVRGVQKLDYERLLVWQPELIIVPTQVENFAQARQNLFHNRFVARTPAGQKGAIVMVDKRYFEAVSQFVTQGFAQLVQALYPQCRDKM